MLLFVHNVNCGQLFLVLLGLIFLALVKSLIAAWNKQMRLFDEIREQERKSIDD